ncbi:hypothetical protein BGZ99_002642 [Dissophora globulifera]|uniref:Uncharacterized protein n=1 Tax=Dissophora globulifera TaxID=979702 RepID=A0A9P6RRM8_9FUNG|nr:hypothetical protein BGZ99_002642 [Dissophora globulifera]
MDNTSNNNPPLQLFQEHSSPDSSSVGSVIRIPTIFDTRSDQYVILWDDIACVFAKAKFVSCDGRRPRMIPYYEGVTLRAIVPEEARWKELFGEMEMIRTQLQIQNQQQFDHAANMENLVQALLAQNYELHEYPIPRHFVILPKVLHKRDILGNLSSPSTVFRLHFLCECGAHTGHEADGSLHQFHLANHNGYDIVKQPEFIRKYGPYLSVMLKIVKYSLIAAEVAVPALRHFKAIDGLDKVVEFLNPTSKPLTTLLEESISFVNDKSIKMDHVVGPNGDSAYLDNLLGLKGPQLRQLESFLSLNDRDRVLGGLYRITTKSGHVKWVCKEHYDRLFQSSAIKELRTFTKDINGTFIQEQGLVSVVLDSEARAKKFYDTMEKAGCVHELRIALEWTVARHHLQDLRDALTKSKIVRLELSGCGKADSASKIDSSLFQPLLDLMSNGWIQTMILERVYHRDFLYVDESVMGLTSRPSKLRELKFADLSTFDYRMMPTLPRMLKFYPSLTTLSVKSAFAHDVLSWIHREPWHLPLLETLTVHETGRRQYHLVVEFSGGEIKSIEVMRLSSKSWHAEGLRKLLFCNRITKLRILLDEPDMQGDRCMEILRRNPEVLEFHLFAPRLSVHAVGWAISLMRKSQASQRPTPQYQIKIHCDTHPEVVSCTLDFNKDSQDIRVSTQIQLNPHVNNMDSMENLIELVGTYGWSVTRLDFKGQFDIELALALDTSMAQFDSILEHFLLDPARLTLLPHYDCVERILKKSKRLKAFSGVLHMEDSNWKAGAEWLLGTHGDLLTGLMLEGANGFIWNREIAKLFPSRSELKNLEVLTLRGVDATKDAEPFVKWVTDMTSKPSPPRILHKIFTRGQSTIAASDSSDRTHLKQIKLDSVTFSKGQWKAIFKTMDYSALEKLTLTDNKLTRKQLKQLLRCIVDFANDDAVLPLEELNIRSQADHELWYLLDDDLTLLRKKAPLIEVNGVLNK